MTVDAMLDEVVRREGGFSHLPADRGGATRWGITQTTLAAWRGRPASVEDVQQLTPGEAKDIYRALYYTRPGFDRLPDPLDDLLFDFAVNSGPQLAIRALQESLGITADGVLGPRTIAAVASADLRALQNGIVRWRVMMLGRLVRRDPSQLQFLGGWLSRALDFLA